MTRSSIIVGAFVAAGSSFIGGCGDESLSPVEIGGGGAAGHGSPGGAGEGGAASVCGTVVAPAQPGPRHVATSDGHACEIDDRGAIRCWGDNDQGQLGDGSTMPSTSAVEAGNDHDWTSVAVSNYASAAINESGELWWWGLVPDGNALEPTFSGDVGWSMLSGREDGFCGIKNDGSIWCWETSAYPFGGFSATAPQELDHEDDWVDVAAGRVFACGDDPTDPFCDDLDRMSPCAIRSDGALYCWNLLGVSRYPVSRHRIGGDNDWLTIDASGFRSDFGSEVGCGVKVNGSLWCFGSGLLGDGQDTFPTLEPVRIGTCNDWSSPRGGRCAIKTNGELHCWGSNLEGQLAVAPDPDNAFALSPREIGNAGWTDVAPAALQTCGLRDDGSVWCWGGQTVALGPTSLTQLGTDTDWVGLAQPAVGRKADGSVWSWREADYVASSVETWSGSHRRYQLVHSRRPTQIAGDALAGGIGNGPDVCLVKPDGTLWCRGSTPCQSLSGFEVASCPFALVQQGTDDDWVTVAVAGARVSTGAPPPSVEQPFPTDPIYGCGIKASGLLLCWGGNTGGQLGNGSTTGSIAPTPVAGAGSWKSVAVAGHDGGDCDCQYGHTCGVRVDGSLWCWGTTPIDPENGRFEHVTVPTRIGAESDWASVAMGSAHSCGLKTDGSMWCWGARASVGVGATDIPVVLSPERLDGGPWKVVSAGDAHTCAVQENGTLWCWGYGWSLGSSSASGVVELFPIQIEGDIDWVDVIVAAKGDTETEGTYALKSDGSLWQLLGVRSVDTQWQLRAAQID